MAANVQAAEIITLRAIALKPLKRSERRRKTSAEIITLRAIALKHKERSSLLMRILAEIITLRAIALKPAASDLPAFVSEQRS